MFTRVLARTAGVLALATGLVSAFAAPGLAAEGPSPLHESFSFTDTFVDPEYCAFPLDVTMTESDRLTTFFNADGSVRQRVIHVTIDFVIQANGRTLLENDHYQLFISPDGSIREVGLHAHILGEHGLVLRDAGNTLFRPDGSVGFMHGPHPQFLGETFCSALSDPADGGT